MKKIKDKFHKVFIYYILRLEKDKQISKVNANIKFTLSKAN
jgi:hypothetical protein